MKNAQFFFKFSKSFERIFASLSYYYFFIVIIVFCLIKTVFLFYFSFNWKSSNKVFLDTRMMNPSEVKGGKR